MRKARSYILIGGTVCCLCILVMILRYGNRNEEGQQVIKIGLCTYKASDTFIASIVSEFEKIMKEVEQERGISIKLDIADAKENQRIQNEQVERYIALEYDMIYINIVDRTSAARLIDRASNAKIPLVFFNRQPVEEDMYRSDGVYYIGSDPKPSAIIQGKLIQEVYEKEPSRLDRNGNERIEYGILEGEAGHPDTIIRTEHAIKAIEKSGIALQKIAGGVANFDRSQASAIVEHWLHNEKQYLELIIANNDDMALGAADALEKLGRDDVAIVGIDGTPQGRQAVEEGILLGTVVSNQALYAEKMFNICEILLLEKQPISYLGLYNDKYDWMPWEKYIMNP